ncbi:DTX3L ligase, partial [Thryothorus ludovicianus]|nr:DTX3L ligase [Thryothorus ludovicianus]
RRSGIMAAAPLLVRLSPSAGASAEKVIRKLESYFQSVKRSGGGECKVRPGPAPGTYCVDFSHQQDRKNVESRKKHTLELGGESLVIIILPGEGDQVVAQASASYNNITASLPLPQQEQQDNAAYGATGKEDLTKKIFLTVSATLNTSMFTEDQREKIATMCPNLKREGNPGMGGCEKLTGDFKDIEKVYRYIENMLANKDPNHDFSHSECKNGLKDENGLNTKEMCEYTVGTALFEYFSHTRKEKIKELQENFGVCIRTEDHEDGNTLICISSDKSPALLKAASDSFIKTFQETTNNLTQEKVPITDSYTLKETIMKLNEKFRNLLAKEEGNQLLLCGPKSEILAAQKFVAEKGENYQAERNMKISSEKYKYRNGIEVDASVFKLLETILNEEIGNIKGKFDTEVETKENSNGQKVIIFRPKHKTSDMSSHATESFINTLQSAFAMSRGNITGMNLSETWKKISNMLPNAMKSEDFTVKPKKNEKKLIISGLPDRLYAGEKYMKPLPNTEASAQTENWAPLSFDLSSQEPTGASKNSSVRQKNNLSSEGQSQAKTEEKEEDECPICKDRIIDKETLEKCKHAFCKICIDRAMTYKKVCPVCNTVCGVLTGNQPEGTMSTRTMPFSLPGYPNCDTIEIAYDMRGGTQNSSHPNPGKHYGPAYRIAYLPDNEEGREILQLLKRAFDQKLIFTVGQSRTTGAPSAITWNDIHHKTAIDGGPTQFGYPDPLYLQRVRSELKAKGIE